MYINNIKHKLLPRDQMANPNIYNTIDISIGKGANFEITNTKTIIKNVPITGEIVQDYQDGVAYKPLEEIKNILVDNVPITFLHPSKAVKAMKTSEAGDNVHGLLKSPSLDEKDNIDESKLYSDLIIFRSEMTKDLEEMLKVGEGIDVSIGFEFVKEEKKGSALGRDFDYIQRKIKLDHLAILIDEFGKVHRGRAPFPFFGIGADQLDEELKMSNENYEKILEEKVKLASDLNDVNVKVESLTSQAATDADAISKLTSDNEDLKSSLKVATDELSVFKDAAKVVIDEMRGELSEKMPAMKAVFDSANDEAIKTAHDEMKKNTATSIDGADGKKKSKVVTDAELVAIQFGKKEDKN